MVLYDQTDAVPAALLARVPAGQRVSVQPLTRNAAPPWDVRLDRNPDPVIYLTTEQFREWAYADADPRPIAGGPATIAATERCKGLATTFRLAEGDRVVVYRIVAGAMSDGWLLAWPD